jgi:Pregnancy-associated plasma protein-A
MSPAPRRKCGAMEVHERLSEEFPSYRANQLRIDEFTERSLRTGEAQRAMRRLITIPVVVHVVYKRDVENISKQQINTQISVLNRDYRAANPDKSSVPAPWESLVTDSKVEFKLATRDPRGKQTDGVTRTKTDVSEFGADDTVKKASTGGVAAWPAKKYLNIWVCNLGGGLLGYAQFPGGPARTDGVVILHSGFGTTGTATAPFDLGRTATHEVGHWLNLRHIWGDTMGCSGGDRVADTPNAAGPNYGKPSFPHITCNNGPNGDMFCNYMDYVDDAAMFMFTTGQVGRMNATLAGPRKSFA